jgi:hypothetical protein
MCKIKQLKNNVIIIIKMSQNLSDLSLKIYDVDSAEYEEISKPFRILSELCRTGNSESIEKFLNTNNISNYDISIAFHGACVDNLENAKWLYDNYKKPCNDYMKTTVFFLQEILRKKNVETLLWLKSLNNPIFISHVDSWLCTLINERCIDCDEFKLLYEHFFDRFEYLNPHKNK